GSRSKICFRMNVGRKSNSFHIQPSHRSYAEISEDLAQPRAAKERVANGTVREERRRSTANEEPCCSNPPVFITLTLLMERDMLPGTPRRPRRVALLLNSDPVLPVVLLLLRRAEGDHQALEQLMPLVYNELRRLARRHLSRERGDHTLQSTALLHEAYLRMAGQDPPVWQT